MAKHAPLLIQASALTISQPFGPRPVRQPRRGPAIVTRAELASLPAVHRCVETIANAIAQLPIYYLTGDTIDTADPLSGFFHEPQPGETWYSYLDGIMYNALLTGNHFNGLVRLGRDGVIEQVQSLRPESVTPEWNTETFRKGYWLDGRKYSDRDLMHFKKQSEGGYAWGISPLKNLGSTWSTHLSEQSYVRSTYEDGARIGGYLSGPPDMHPDVLGKTAQQVADNVGGRGSGVMALPGNFEWHQVALNHEDLELISARRLSLVETAMIMGIPPHLIGIPVDGTTSTYANVRQDMQSFEALTLSRYKRMIRDTHARFGIRFEFGELDLAKPPIGERYGAYQVGIDAGIIDAAEAREKEGMLGPPPERPAEQTKQLTFQAAPIGGGDG